jgi:hypothetical protein
MTTDRDRIIADNSGLPICTKCGWYDAFDHAQRCQPDRGALAARLIEAAPEIRAGQLGYGDACVIFDLTDDFAVVLRNNGPSTFALSRVHLLDDLSVEEAAALVRSLKAWMDVRDAMRELARREDVG